jgi:hypothetical protein
VRTKLKFVALLIMISAGVTFAQQAARQTPRRDDDDVVRITANLVQMDAVVVDQDGKGVTDLKPDEVRIFENDRAQS